MKKFKYIIFLVFIVVLSIYTFVSPEASTNAKTLGQLKNELASLRNKKAQKDNEKKQTQGQIAASNQSIASAKNEITVNQGKIEQAKSDIVALNKDIDETKENKLYDEIMKYFHQKYPDVDSLQSSSIDSINNDNQQNA